MVLLSKHGPRFGQPGPSQIPLLWTRLHVYRTTSPAARHRTVDKLALHPRGIRGPGEWRNRGACPMKAKMISSDRRRLEREAEKLIREGRMPTLDEVLQAVFETRRKFVPLIRAARA